MSSTLRGRRQANRHGLIAEHAAAWLLRVKGYRILDFRYRVRGGEIDIVARRGDTIAFVEVKARPALDEARAAIGDVKRRRLSKAVKVWLASHPWAAALTWRGDAVFVAPWRWPRHAIAVIELDLD